VNVEMESVHEYKTQTIHSLAALTSSLLQHHHQQQQQQPNRRVRYPLHSTRPFKSKAMNRLAEGNQRALLPCLGSHMNAVYACLVCCFLLVLLTPHPHPPCACRFALPSSSCRLIKTHAWGTFFWGARWALTR